VAVTPEGVQEIPAKNGHGAPPQRHSSAPPTAPGALPPRPQQWPVVLGALSLVQGGIMALGLLIAAWILSSETYHTIVSSGPGGAVTVTPGQQGDSALALRDVLGLIALAVLSLLALITSLGLLDRRRWSLRAARIWLVWGLLMVPGTLVWIIAYEPPVPASQPAAAPVWPPSPVAARDAAIGFALIIGGAAGLALWYAVLPFQALRLNRYAPLAGRRG
jgi:hypothetical protein